MSLLAETRNLGVRPDAKPPAVVHDGRLLVDLGGTAAEIRSTDEDWLSAVRDRFGFFAVDGCPVDITITHTPDEQAMRARHGCLSILHSGGREATIAASEGTAVLDGVLRTMLPPLIAPDLMVHGALLAHRRRGFLCCGVSGSGKSTVAALFPDVALCDEMVRLAVDPAPEARSLPFWKARPGAVPLTAVFELTHGVENSREPLGTTEAIQTLRRHVYWPVEQPSRMVSSFNTLSDICQTIPVFRLAFRPDRTVWATMAEGF